MTVASQTRNIGGQRWSFMQTKSYRLNFFRANTRTAKGPWITRTSLPERPPAVSTRTYRLFPRTGRRYLNRYPGRLRGFHCRRRGDESLLGASFIILPFQLVQHSFCHPVTGQSRLAIEPQGR